MDGVLCGEKEVEIKSYPTLMCRVKECSLRPEGNKEPVKDSEQVISTLDSQFRNIIVVIV